MSDRKYKDTPTTHTLPLADCRVCGGKEFRAALFSREHCESVSLTVAKGLTFDLLNHSCRTNSAEMKGDRGRKNRDLEKLCVGLSFV